MESRQGHWKKHAEVCRTGRDIVGYREFNEQSPTCYQGEEFQEPVFTPNILIRGQPANLLVEDLSKVGNEEELPKRLSFLARSKEQLRRRWIREYLHAMEERQSRYTGNDTKVPKVGAVVLLKEEIKNKAQWKIGRFIGTISGKDGIIRGLSIKLGNDNTVEWPLQLICDLEIGEQSEAITLNPKAAEFVPRTRTSRKAKETATHQITAIGLYEDEEN